MTTATATFTPVDLVAESFPGEPPHWDGISDQLRDWFEAHTRLVGGDPDDHPAHRWELRGRQTCLVAIDHGQTLADLDVPERPTLTVRGERYRLAVSEPFAYGHYHTIQVEII